MAPGKAKHKQLTRSVSSRHLFAGRGGESLPPNDCQTVCSVFFDWDNELQINYGNFLLINNKHRKLIVIKWSKGCKFVAKMHQNTFGGRTLPGPAGGAYAPYALTATVGATSKTREGRGGSIFLRGTEWRWNEFPTESRRVEYTLQLTCHGSNKKRPVKTKNYNYLRFCWYQMFFVTYSIYMLKTDNKLFVFAVRVTKVKGHKNDKTMSRKAKS